MESDTLDDLDRQVLHALLLDARAPFARIGAVLGVSDRTVARRYAKLRAAAGLRLTALTEPRHVGEVRWFLRVTCAPGHAAQLANALAARADTSWVNLLAGGTEIAFATRAPTLGADRALEAALTRSPNVIAVSAQLFLHRFFGGPRNVIGKYGALSADQIAALSADALEPDEPDRRIELSEVDRQLLEALAVDGRRPIEDVASATGLPAGTARRRLAALRAEGTLYFDVTVAPHVLAAPLRTVVWISVAPGDLEAAGEALAGHLPVAYAAATTGATNLYASLLTRDEDELYRYLSTTLGSLGTIRQVESAPVTRTVKAESGIAMRTWARR
ncbi:MAG TPA: AsnC family transcriptional regulator [Cellulomonas sp.]